MISKLISGSITITRTGNMRLIDPGHIAKVTGSDHSCIIGIHYDVILALYRHICRADDDRRIILDGKYLLAFICSSTGIGSSIGVGIGRAGTIVRSILYRACDNGRETEVTGSHYSSVIGVDIDVSKAFYGHICRAGDDRTIVLYGEGLLAGSHSSAIIRYRIGISVSRTGTI